MRLGEKSVDMGMLLPVEDRAQGIDEEETHER